MCSRKFFGDVNKTPSILLGKHFASSIKQSPRVKRARERDEQKILRELSHRYLWLRTHESMLCGNRSRSVTPLTVVPSPQVHTATCSYCSCWRTVGK